MAKYLYWLIPEYIWAEQKGQRCIAEQDCSTQNGLALLFGYQVNKELKVLDPARRYFLVQFDAEAIAPCIRMRPTEQHGLRPYAFGKIPAHAVAAAQTLEYKMGIWLLPDSYRTGQHQEVTRVYLVRHGQTEWEKQGRFEGRLDSPLTDAAQQLARRRGAELKSKNFVAAVSSSAGRALSTRNVLTSDWQVPKATHPGLVDIHLGELEGMSELDAQKMYPEAIHDYLENPDTFTAPNGESFEAVQYRAVNTINQLARQFQGGSILVVAHASIIATVACHFEKTSLTEFWRHGDVANLTGLVATYRGRDGWVESLWREDVVSITSKSA